MATIAGGMRGRSPSSWRPGAPPPATTSSRRVPRRATSRGGTSTAGGRTMASRSISTTQDWSLPGGAEESYVYLFAARYRDGRGAMDGRSSEPRGGGVSVAHDRVARSGARPAAAGRSSQDDAVRAPRVGADALRLGARRHLRDVPMRARSTPATSTLITTPSPFTSVGCSRLIRESTPMASSLTMATARTTIRAPSPTIRSPFTIRRRRFPRGRGRRDLLAPRMTAGSYG